MFYVLTIVVLVGLSALFSGSECAFLSVNKLRLSAQCREGKKRALRVAHLISNKDALINSLLVANDLVNIALSSVFTIWALQTFGDGALTVATLCATVVLLIFGEITPKSICVKRPDKIAYALSGFVLAVTVILKPVVFFFSAVSNLALRIKGVDTRAKVASYTKTDIKEYIDSAENAHTLKTGDMMGRVFSFTDSAARDIMVKRDDIVGFPADTAMAFIIDSAKKSGYSYFPIYTVSIDKIIGVLYLKDLMKGYDGDATVGTLDILRQPLFVTADSKMTAVFSKMERERQSFAIVLHNNECIGLITKAAIAKKVFG